MIRFDALAAAMLMAATGAGTAFSGDLPPEITVPEVSVKDAQGFYGRADLGYTVQNSHHGARLRTDDAATGAESDASFDSTRFSGGDFSGGLGIGYQFNDLFRADITGDLFRGDFNGAFTSAAPCAGGVGGTGCSAKSAASYSAGSLLANGYVDIGTLAGFTPYVGAGLGATRVSWGDVSTTSSCVAGASACSTGGGTSTGGSGRDDWRFTYALMAGVAYQLAPNVKLDVGYRYSHVAGGDMFDTSAAAGTNATATRDGGFGRQEIRVGLRVATW